MSGRHYLDSASPKPGLPSPAAAPRAPLCPLVLLTPSQGAVIPLQPGDRTVAAVGCPQRTAPFPARHAGEVAAPRAVSPDPAPCTAPALWNRHWPGCHSSVTLQCGRILHGDCHQGAWNDCHTHSPYRGCWEPSLQGISMPQNKPQSMCSNVSLAACPQETETLILLVLASYAVSELSHNL